MSQSVEGVQIAKAGPRHGLVAADGRWITMGLGVAALLTLGLPLIVTALWSLMNPSSGWFAPDILPPSLALAHWREALSDRTIPGAFLTSLLIGVCVTVLTGVLALPTAYALAKLPFRAKRAVELFVLAPLIVPGIIVAVSIGSLFFRLGLVYTIPGVILVQTIGTLPFMIRILAATIEGVPDDILHAARSLGAGPLQVARHILVPVAGPGFLAGGLLTFISSFEEFEKTFIIGAPFVQTLPVILWTYLGGRVIVFPTAAVVTFLLLAPMLLIFFLAERVLRDDVLAAGMGKV